MVKRLILAAAATALMMAGSAFGHAKLRGSEPAADAELAGSPKSLSLSFNEKVQLAVLTLTTDAGSLPLTIDRDRPAALQVTVPLPALKPGKYQVQWSALSAADGHVSKGGFAFTILGAAADAAAAAH